MHRSPNVLLHDNFNPTGFHSRKNILDRKGPFGNRKFHRSAKTRQLPILYIEVESQLDVIRPGASMSELTKSAEINELSAGFCAVNVHGTTQKDFASKVNCMNNAALTTAIGSKQ